MKSFPSFAALSLAFLISCTASAEVVFLEPIITGSSRDNGPQDGVFDSISPPPNDRNLTNNGFVESRFATEFDLSVIPTGVDIASAKLETCISVFPDQALNDPQDREIELHGYAGNSFLELQDFEENGLLQNVTLLPTGGQAVIFDVSTQLLNLRSIGARYAGYNIREISNQGDPNYLVMRVGQPCAGLNPPLRLAIELVEIDADSDGIPDDIDNCQFIPNPNQQDSDGDLLGDACDSDADGDGVSNSVDNCPLVLNPDQADTDFDGLGDLCDLDADGDNVFDAEDACPGTSLSEPTNADGCSVPQICPFNNQWKNFRAYLGCILKTTRQFIDEGIMTKAEAKALFIERQKQRLLFLKNRLK